LGGANILPYLNKQDLISVKRQEKEIRHIRKVI